MKINSFTPYLIICFLFSISVNLFGQVQDSTSIEPKSKISFRDPVDNAFDMSSFLLEHHGLLPVPTIITEPALGYGGGGALVYFHTRKKQYDTYVAPDLSGILGMGTENGTWGVGAFHMHTFGEDRVRTLALVVKPDISYKYYGNNSAILSKYPVTVNLDSWYIMMRAKVRVATTKFFVGATYSYFRSDITLDTIPRNTIVNDLIKRLNVNSVRSTLEPTIVYDNRDNVFTPTRGINAELSLSYSAEWLGSDDNYKVFNTNFYAYQPVSEKLFSGFRFQGSYLLGDAPFYAYPYINLRGIPLMRYQSDNTVVAETEWRYNVYKRLSVLAFTGAGKAFPTASEFNDADWAYTIGTGFRYQIARLLGIHMGTDFAWGNGEDFAFYVVFGSSW